MYIPFMFVIPMLGILKMLWDHTEKIGELWERIEILESLSNNRSCSEEKK